VQSPDEVPLDDDVIETALQIDVIVDTAALLVPPGPPTPLLPPSRK
jgi:hypothetical protein